MTDKRIKSTLESKKLRKVNNTPPKKRNFFKRLRKRKPEGHKRRKVGVRRMVRT